jgi:hypothetical protein
MTVFRSVRNASVLLVLAGCLAAAQSAQSDVSAANSADASSPTSSDPLPTSSSALTNRQSMADAWWTGPLLAPSANTLPPGHVLVEPYLYDVTTQGFYNSSGTRVSVPHGNGFGSLTYINYGLANRFTVGVIPVFGYNQVSKGLGSSGVGMGDLTLQAQYRLHLFHEGSWAPTTSVAVQQALPTGRYDQLGDRPAEGLGAGAYTTTLCFYNQTFFWMPNGRILRTRFNVTQAFSHSVRIDDVSVYGTSQGFRGHASPGPALFVDAAWEYSITRHWVLAFDAVYRHQYNTPVSGYNIADPTVSILLNSGSSQVFGLAPAVEYNFNSKVGVIFGTRIFPAGKNTTDSITPVIAVNIVH